jgi:hypothetical protein
MYINVTVRSKYYNAVKVCPHLPKLSQYYPHANILPHARQTEQIMNTMAPAECAVLYSVSDASFRTKWT